MLYWILLVLIFDHFSFFLGVTTIILYFVSIQWLVFQNVLTRRRKILCLESSLGSEEGRVREVRIQQVQCLKSGLTYRRAEYLDPV